LVTAQYKHIRKAVNLRCSN